MPVADLERRRRLIVLRHERTFIQFYLSVQRIMRLGLVFRNGIDAVFCNSQFFHGFKEVRKFGIIIHLKETKSFKIRRELGAIVISLKEPENDNH